MATSKSSPLDQSFRYLLLHVGTELNAKNCTSLRFLYQMGTQKSGGEVPGLDILQELHSQTYFTALNPDRLQSDLTRIKRQDLANCVEQYKKTSEFKKAVKQHQEEGRAVKKGAVRGGHLEDPTYLEIVVTNQKQGGASSTPEERCVHLLGITFMHALQSVDQSRYLVEAVLKEADELAKKKEVTTAIGDIRRDFDRISTSLKKVIAVTKDMRSEAAEVTEYSVEETSRPPVPKKPMLPKKPCITHSASHSNLYLRPLRKSSSSELSDYGGVTPPTSRTSSISKSEEDLRQATQYAYINTRVRRDAFSIRPQNNTEGEQTLTGDSGCDTSWNSVLPSERGNDDLGKELAGDEYEALNTKTKDDEHDYAAYKKYQS